jgi:predicted nucleic acid-binding protein
MYTISNTTPLIGLSILGRFELLKDLFENLYIPESVYQEVTIKGTGSYGADEVERGVAEKWIHILSATANDVLTALKVDLDDGEAEVISLALERRADLLLVDERKARIRAQALGFNVTGTVGILLFAQASGVEINLQDALDKLRMNGFRISDSLYRIILNL